MSNENRMPSIINKRIVIIASLLFYFSIFFVFICQPRHRIHFDFSFNHMYSWLDECKIEFWMFLKTPKANPTQHFLFAFNFCQANDSIDSIIAIHNSKFVDWMCHINHLSKSRNECIQMHLIYLYDNSGAHGKNMI